MMELTRLNYLRMSIVLYKLDATPKLRETIYLSVMKFLRECSQACAPCESFASVNMAMIKICRDTF